MTTYQWYIKLIGSRSCNEYKFHWLKNLLILKIEYFFSFPISEFCFGYCAIMILFPKTEKLCLTRGIEKKSTLCLFIIVHGILYCLVTVSIILFTLCWLLLWSLASNVSKESWGLNFIFFSVVQIRQVLTAMRRGENLRIEVCIWILLKYALHSCHFIMLRCDLVTFNDDC